MILALFLAVGVSAINVAVGRRLSRRPGARFWRGQALGFLFRFVAIFGGATGLWLGRGRMTEVAVFIIAAALLQMIGQIYLLNGNDEHA
ncbi:MAG: hypothetical protein HY077_01065 [Elusimicrobia bacterium]|nr:hypothetical protein [Elusimicrobiota bacterium]